MARVYSSIYNPYFSMYLLLYLLFDLRNWRVAAEFLDTQQVFDALHLLFLDLFLKTLHYLDQQENINKITLNRLKNQEAAANKN